MRVKREKSTSSVGHYIRNADLLPAIKEAKQKGKVTNKLISMIQIIAQNYSKKANFAGYSFREDMVSSAVENLCKNALKFDDEKYSNPFAFYTTAIHNSFLQFMADEKKHRNIRDSLLLDAGANPSFNFLQGESDESDFEIKESDYSDFTFSRKTIEEDEIPQVNDNSEIKEDRIRYKDRIPGEVVSLDVSKVVYDEARGIFIQK